MSSPAPHDRPAGRCHRSAAREAYKIHPGATIYPYPYPEPCFDEIVDFSPSRSVIVSCCCSRHDSVGVLPKALAFSSRRFDQATRCNIQHRNPRRWCYLPSHQGKRILIPAPRYDPKTKTGRRVGPFTESFCITRLGKKRMFPGRPSMSVCLFAYIKNVVAKNFRKSGKYVSFILMS